MRKTCSSRQQEERLAAVVEELAKHNPPALEQWLREGEISLTAKEILVGELSSTQE